ncbi:LmeA family phospholipid-binding protein [Saccharopolyspora sp. 6M]|uniref:LmeA family phospholipid-binding protein n=1 Tax=Saccharopolyspora sp. 6M TaxID=2877237 RepID=UPI001CD732FE|nr:LmeA family phospholipid-binding protein [Saccharopolyspora sp. 6M]MCA1226752.1 LmeA family phospholipid-binding protein [Saccharopolyspora sp. 6M]
MKKLVVTLLLVLGLLVVADYGAASVAEYQVSQQVREQLELDEDPSVRVHGFPFLTQAVAGDYRDVELAAKAVRVGRLSELGVEANLHHARVPLSDVVGGTANEIQVDELVGRVKLKASDVGRFIGITDLTINPAPKDALDEPADDANEGSSGTAGTGTSDRSRAKVALDGSLDIAGNDVRVKVIAVLSLLNGQLTIEPKKLDIADQALSDIPLGDVFEKSILQQFTTTIDPGVLPFEVRPTAVRVERGALVMEGTAEDVTIGAGGVTTG